MKIVTFGELMLRLSPPGFERFVQAGSFDVTYGGSEANVAVSLAQFGHEAHFVCRLPRHAIGQAAVNDLQRCGVRTDHIVRAGERIGAYFLEKGASQRPSQVIYDRAYSAFSQMHPAELDWDAIMHKVQWLHWSGITPALGPNVQACLEAACIAARKAGATISCDLNYRAKLWSEREAQHVMRPLMAQVDVCIANEEDAQRSLGFDVARTDVEQAELDEAAFGSLIRRLKEEFDFRAVAITLRESFSASRNAWSALLHDEKDCRVPYRSARYDIQIVDRVGAGDSFAGGLIHGLLTGSSTQEALEFAVAASCLKHTLAGDYNLVTAAEVEKLMGGRGSGRVER
ncbi:MAG: sugar kinase [Bacteroidota bacterium]|nr:sugar kinase [Bacteroidota bacterium]